MSKGRRDKDFLLDILDAIDRALDYTNGITWDEYLQDHKTQDAVVRNLEILGEATNNLSDEFRAKYPAIPWRDIAGTRNRLVHHYFGINQEIVWQIIQQDLPKLKQQIDQAVSDFPDKEA